MDAPTTSFPKGRILAVAGLILFAAATVWINYKVKGDVQGGRGGGAVREMGSVKFGQPAPDFSALDLSNRMVSLADYRGRKVVLLDFWATSCSPCRMETVGLQTLQDKFNAARFEVLSLNQQEAADQVSQFIHRKQYGFHVLLDNGAVSGKYGVRGIPTLVLVDTNGIVQWLQVGYSADDDDLRKKIEDLTRQ
ncbi:MAG: TlpA disulfide reductase family protein [Verrucomicrobiota bacterium]